MFTLEHNKPTIEHWWSDEVFGSGVCPINRKSMVEPIQIVPVWVRVVVECPSEICDVSFKVTRSQPVMGRSQALFWDQGTLSLDQNAQVGEVAPIVPDDWPSFGVATSKQISVTCYNLCSSPNHHLRGTGTVKHYHNCNSHPGGPCPDFTKSGELSSEHLFSDIHWVSSNQWPDVSLTKCWRAESSSTWMIRSLQLGLIMTLENSSRQRTTSVPTEESPMSAEPENEWKMRPMMIMFITTNCAVSITAMERLE